MTLVRAKTADNAWLMSLLSRIAAVVLFAVCTTTVCADELVENISVPAPGSQERQLGRLIGRSNGSVERSAAEEWEGKWILDGHGLALTTLRRSKTTHRLLMFGYSAHAKRYWRIAVSATGPARPRVQVSWFVIDGDTWLFERGDDSNDRVMWQFVGHDDVIIAKRVGQEAAQTTVGRLRRVDGAAPDAIAAQRLNPAQDAARPPPVQQMTNLQGWQGRWLTKHPSGFGFDVDGVTDAVLIGDGNFLAWFENSALLYPSGKRLQSIEVDIWGFSDTAKLYLRIDVSSFEGEPLILRPESRWFAEYGDRIVIVKPLFRKSVDGTTVLSRFGFRLEAPDALVVFEEHSSDGVRWTAAPSSTMIWTRIPK